MNDKVFIDFDKLAYIGKIIDRMSYMPLINKVITFLSFIMSLYFINVSIYYYFVFMAIMFFNAYMDGYYLFKERMWREIFVNISKAYSKGINANIEDFQEHIDSKYSFMEFIGISSVSLSFHYYFMFLSILSLVIKTFVVWI